MYTYNSRAYNKRQEQRRKKNQAATPTRRVGGCSACAKAKAAFRARQQQRRVS